EETFHFAVQAGKQEVLFCGISTGASLAAVHQNLKNIEPGATILTFCYDSGDRYLSVEDLY
ncbi:MAG: cysteine synthase A, partial [Candidatus Marinimicrobia bacterium]|nr:cysteine synthase A [Candidatus Neomarinimicrobiota bacterium]